MMTAPTVGRKAPITGPPNLLWARDAASDTQSDG